MQSNRDYLTKLLEILHATLVEVEIAIDSATYPDWSDTKQNLVMAMDLARKLEQQQIWSKLGKK